MRKLKLVVAAVAIATTVHSAADAKKRQAEFVVVNVDVGVPVFPYDITDRPYRVIAVVEKEVRRATLFSKNASPEKVYRELFVRTPPDVAVQVVNVRVSVSAPVPGGGMALRGKRTGSAEEALKGRRKVYFPDAAGFVDSAVYDRYRLPVGATLAGPTVVEEKESPLVFGPGAACEVHASGSLVITLPTAGG